MNINWSLFANNIINYLGKNSASITFYIVIYILIQLRTMYPLLFTDVIFFALLPLIVAIYTNILKNPIKDLNDLLSRAQTIIYLMKESGLEFEKVIEIIDSNDLTKIVSFSKK